MMKVRWVMTQQVTIGPRCSWGSLPPREVIGKEERVPPLWWKGSRPKTSWGTTGSESKKVASGTFISCVYSSSRPLGWFTSSAFRCSCLLILEDHSLRPLHRSAVAHLQLETVIVRLDLWPKPSRSRPLPVHHIITAFYCNYSIVTACVPSTVFQSFFAADFHGKEKGHVCINWIFHQCPSLNSISRNKPSIRNYFD